MFQEQRRNPVNDYYKVNEELKQYSEKLAKRTQIIVANKIDSMQDSNLYEDLEKVAKEHNQKIFKISGVTGEGVEELMNYVSKTLKTLPKENLIEIKEKEKVYTLKDEEDFTITREKGVFVVKGEKVDSIMRKVNIEIMNHYSIYTENLMK